MVRPLVAGNWKMNGLSGSLKEVRAVVKALANHPVKCDVMICPPATLLQSMKEAAKGSKLRLGGQDCHASSQGAHTGDLSPEMLKNGGASAVIVGHSERRQDHGESNMDVRAKGAGAHRAGLAAIICIGETLSQREKGQALRAVGHQLKGSLPATANARNTVIAYEPVWAIGSGLTPSADDVAKLHGHLRKTLSKLLPEGEARRMRILYGGSVKPQNALELLTIENVNGALVGGASLKAADFKEVFGIYR
ncbi:MAG: triose-phosphate isomerase [Pseudomonadota bacterium]